MQNFWILLSYSQENRHEEGMMRGLEFINPGKYGKIVAELLKGIPLESYDWYISEHEIIKDNDNYQIPKKLNGNEMEDFFFLSNYLTISVNIQAYPVDKQKVKLENYTDFLTSSCEINLLIFDLCHTEIYVKNQQHFLTFIKNAEECGCTDIMVKTDQGDTRTKLSIT